jgi:ring-1,2-phenylacetyl-CoA epoxidase subunit PaaE
VQQPSGIKVKTIFNYNKTTESSMNQCKVIKQSQETDDTISLYLKNEGDSSFLPGQFITLVFDIKGKSIKRCYSLSSTPNEDLWRITVKKVKGGLVSNYLHNSSLIGEMLPYEGPEGRFTMEGINAKTHFFIGAGSGITPLYSMIADTIADSDEQFILFIGNKNKDQVIFSESWRALSAKYPNLEIQHFYSRPGLKGMFKGKKQDYIKGRIGGKAIIKKIRASELDLATTAFYICGPSNMNVEIREELVNIGVSEDNIRTEYFFTDDLDLEFETGEYQLTFQLDGEVQKTKAHKEKSILQSLLDNGFDPPYSCTSGTCCTCMAELKTGEVHMGRSDTLSKSERESGFILTCQSKPISDEIYVNYDID